MQRRVLLGGVVIAVLLLAVSGLSAQKPAMTIVDLINVPYLGDAQLSPSGDQVLYVRSDPNWERNRTISHIWRIAVDGTGQVQLTNGPDGESSPRWSPDGARIAFLAQRGDAEDRQIYLIPNSGGEGRALTKHATSVSSLTWSPDGKWIYFEAADPRPDTLEKRLKAHDDVFAFDENYQQRHIWRVDTATGEEQRLTSGNFSVVEYALSRDGAMIALERGPDPLLGDLRKREVFVMSAAPDAEMRQLTHNDVPEYGPQLSPDNATVLFTADSNEKFESYYNDNIFLVPSAGGQTRMLTGDLDYEVGGAEWTRTGDGIFFLANTGVRQDVFRIDPDSRKVTQLTQGDHAVGSIMYSPDARRFVASISTPQTPGEVWVMDETGKGLRQVTSVYDYLAKDFTLARAEVVHWKGDDGVTVEGILYYPLNYVEGQRYPLVVQTHGGPAASDKLSWAGSSNYVQKLAGMGYMVLKPNYRGSTGYGDAFLRDMVGHYYHEAHKDVMTGVDYLISRGLVDGDHMAKMGWSGGGHMTDKIITYTDRFKAAASGAGAANWISMYAQSDVRFYRTPWFGGTPWQKDAPIDVYWNNSPLKDAWKVKTPTIFLVGQQDHRVPMPQSVEMYRALKSNGVPTHLYVAPREPHGWRELRHRLFKANVELDWFQHWLWDKDYTWEKAPAGNGGA